MTRYIIKNCKITTLVIVGHNTEEKENLFLKNSGLVDLETLKGRFMKIFMVNRLEFLTVYRR